MKLWRDIGFEIEITGDQSPSLRLLASVDPTKDRGESMHHSGGACSETALIYGEPLREILQKVAKPHFVIVGLGLGYIEMFVARESLCLGKKTSDVGLITSYESVSELREFFIDWLWDQKEKLSTEVWDTYELVAESILKETSFHKEDLKIFLRHFFKSTGDIQGALSEEILLPSRYHGIMYDAFSSKTSPFLWEEEFLNKFLNQGAAEQCILSTYACKGTLKRALREQGFKVFVREGFQGKRNSTRGERNL